MIHVVFQQADIAVMKKAMELDAVLTGDIFEIKDDLAVGPLAGVDTDEGWMARTGWWMDLVQASPYAGDIKAGEIDDRKTVQALKERLDADAKEEAWIWVGQNQHDVCGYYWLVSQLKAYQGRIVILFLNNLPFINEKGQIFYPKTIHEILPKEIVKAKKLNRKVTASEFEVDPDEWQRIANEGSMVRILEGGKKIAGKGEDYYDKDVVTGLTTEWQKGNRAMHNILSKMPVKTGDVFLLWRARQLVEAGKLELHGDPAKGWKDFELRIKPAISLEMAVESGEQAQENKDSPV
jgi:hypothetical protein